MDLCTELKGVFSTGDCSLNWSDYHDSSTRSAFYSLLKLWTVATVTTLNFSEEYLWGSTMSLVVHWTYAPLHRKWNDVTNLTWVLLYPGVILAVLSTEKQVGMACRETRDERVGKQAVNLTFSGMKADRSSVAWSANLFPLCHVGILKNACWWCIWTGTFKEKVEKSGKWSARENNENP